VVIAFGTLSSFLTQLHMVSGGVLAVCPSYIWTDCRKDKIPKYTASIQDLCIPAKGQTTQTTPLTM